MENFNYFTIPGLKCKGKVVVSKSDKIIVAVEDHFEIDFSKMLETKRGMKKAFPLQVLIYFLQRYTDLNISEIARLVKRDHTTVRYTIHTVQRRIERKESVKMEIEIIRNKILVLLKPKS